ncbi:MAG: HlyD family efflux transporter periplasmic adaptor subunit [Cognatishimia sp.]|uniref:efflux RND transporter periplasmic adaptor subunit n=1 Tax=Cognatishimia sp. TaxID=2211648 RepID=UPI003B8E106E
MRFLRQSLMGLFLLAVTLGLLAAAVQVFSSALNERMSQEPRAQQQRERVFTVNVQRADPMTVTPKIAVFGQVESQRSLDIRASSGGVIRNLATTFQDGGRISQGQLLAQLDTADAEDARARAQSDLRTAQSEVREATQALEIARAEWDAAVEQLTLREKALARQRDLESRGVGTAAAIETAELNLSNARQQELSRRQAAAQSEARLDQAGNQVERAKIAEAEANRNLADRQIFAEFDGTLSDVNVVEGGLVSANERLARLIDPNALEVSFRVSTAQYARLLDASGGVRLANVEVVLEVSGVKLQAAGQISRDSAAVGEGQTGRLIFATLSEARGLKPGDFVSVFVDEAELTNAVALPSSALDAQGRVLVVGEGERLDAIPVTLLRRQGDQILVAGREVAGKLVVTRLTPLLGAGIRVKPVGESVAPPPEQPAMVELSDGRRAKLLAFVESNQRMPADRKARILEQLAQPSVPAQVVNRLEQRMGG